MYFCSLWAGIITEIIREAFAGFSFTADFPRSAPKAFFFLKKKGMGFSANTDFNSIAASNLNLPADGGYWENTLAPQIRFNSPLASLLNLYQLSAVDALNHESRLYY